MTVYGHKSMYINILMPGKLWQINTVKYHSKIQQQTVGSYSNKDKLSSRITINKSWEQMAGSFGNSVLAKHGKAEWIKNPTQHFFSW